METKILDIAKMVYHNHLTPETATNLLVDLFAVHDTQASQKNNVLTAGYSFMLGDFQILLDEDTKELKVIVHNNKLRLTIKPNSDNSCTLVGSR